MILRIFTVLLIFLKIEILETAECKSQPVTLSKDNMRFDIASNETDLDSKNCIYQFIVPKYFVPTVAFVNLQLTGENKMTLSQYSEYGGLKSWQPTNDTFFDLGPVNFTLEISLPEKTVNDRFFVRVDVRDATPLTSGQSFMIKPDLGHIIDSQNVSGNSSMVQMFDNDHPTGTFQIRIALFSVPSFVWNLISNIHVYDMGVYKGSLLDVWVAQNSSKDCLGSQFALVNANYFSVGPFSVLMMPKSDWTGQVNIQGAPLGTSTQSYTATNGATVFLEVTNQYAGYQIPSVLTKFLFRGNGTLQIYGGCIPGPQENRRIATISPSNADAYDQLMIFGRCKTYVLSQGLLQWSKTDGYFTDFTHKIGRKGVIMSDSFPYPSEVDSFRNYLIQAPNSKENIIVTYETAYMSGNTTFDIEESISAGKKQYYSLMPSNNSYVSPKTYQQLSNFTVKKGYDGILVRYTVTSTSTGANFGVLVMIVMVFNHFFRV